jgi:trk system potassium uptake protein TrkA
VSTIVAKASDRLHGEILRRVGATRVVYPEREAGARVAHLFAVPQVVDYLDVGPRYGIQKLQPPEAWVWRSLGQLDLPGRLKLIPIALRRAKDVTVNPHDVEVIKPGDELILIGLDEKLEHLADA